MLYKINLFEQDFVLVEQVNYRKTRNDDNHFIFLYTKIYITQSHLFQINTLLLLLSIYLHFN